MSIDPTRRALRAVPALLVAALALTACASGGDAEPDAASGADLLPAAEGTTDYPLTIDTWAGESTFDERPERIAVVGFSTNLDVLQVLDVVPVYAITEDFAWGWRDESWAEQIEAVDTATRSDDLNYEGIAAAQPDAIVALNYLSDEAQFERLTEIAPVIELSEQAGNQADWRAGQELVGDVLDLAAASDAAIVDADAAIAAVAGDHPEHAGQTITIGYDYGPESGFDYYTPTGGTAESVMLDLGFAPNPLAEQFVDDSIVSDENVGLLDADMLVVVYADEATRLAREAQPLFQAIPAVAEGRYSTVTFDGDLLYAEDGSEVGNAVWVLRRGASAASLPWAVDVIATQWLAGADLG